MKYHVVYTAQFHQALDAQLAHLLEQGAPKARLERWLGDLLNVVDDLKAYPLRHPVAEPESSIQGAEIHKLVFGDSLIFYHVDDDEETVAILGFRHGARLR